MTKEFHHCGTKILETERLILRPFRQEDAEAMFQNWASNPNVTKFLTWPVHQSAELTRLLLAEWEKTYEDPATYHWAITLKSDGDVIGDISVVRANDSVFSAELGWCMGEKWWGQGIKPEAALAVHDYLFDRVGYRRLEACHDKNNPKSGRVMQKIGMQYEGARRASGRNNQGICDLCLYGILSEDRK